MNYSHSELESENFSNETNSSVLIEVHNEAGDLQILQATLLELCTWNATLRVRQTFKLDQQTNLRIYAPELKAPIDVASENCSTHHDNHNNQLLICSFEPQIPESILENLGQKSLVDRRTHERVSTELNVAASCEMGNARIPIHLINFSEGGFCLKSSVPLKPHSRILLRMQSIMGQEAKEDHIIAKSRWQVESGGHHIVGCEFLDPDSHQLLKQLHETIQDSGNPTFWKRLFGG